MRVVFISPDFQSSLTTKTNISIAYLETVIEDFMNERFSISSDTFIRFYGDWQVYTREDCQENGDYQEDFNLYYQGTILELLPPVW